MRFLDPSLLRLREDALVDAASTLSSAVLFSCLRSFSECFESSSPLGAPMPKKDKLILFLSCRTGLASGTGEVTLVPFTFGVALGDGLATRDVAVTDASHDPVGERRRCCTGAAMGIKFASSS